MLTLVCGVALSVACANRQPVLWSQADAAEWVGRDPGRRLSSLGEDSRTVIDYDVYGCFFDHHYRLEIHGGLSPHVSIYEIGWDEKPRTTTLLGELPLSAGELAQLDRGLSLHRATLPCLTSGYTELRVSWYEGDRRTGREKLTSDYCRSVSDGIDIIQFGELVERVARRDT